MTKKEENKINKEAYIDAKKTSKQKGGVSFPDTEISETKVITYLKRIGRNDLAKKYILDKAQKKSEVAKIRAIEKANIYAVEEYWCDKCGRIHKRYRKSDGKKIKIYYDHKEHARKIDKDELWKEQFKKNWRHQVEQQKKTGQAVGTPKRDYKKKSSYK